jgi:hypothetical protein
MIERKKDKYFVERFDKIYIVNVLIDANIKIVEQIA